MVTRETKITAAVFAAAPHLKVVGRAGVGVEVLEAAGHDPGGVDELVDVGLLEADHPAEPVGGQPAGVHQAVHGPGRDAEQPGGVGRAHLLVGAHAAIVGSVRADGNGSPVRVTPGRWWRS